MRALSFAEREGPHLLVVAARRRAPSSPQIGEELGAVGGSARKMALSGQSQLATDPKGGLARFRRNGASGWKGKPRGLEARPIDSSVAAVHRAGEPFPAGGIGVGGAADH